MRTCLTLSLLACVAAAGCHDDRSATPLPAPSYAAPVLSSVSPLSGPTAGGTAFTLSGGFFRAGAKVRVGGTLATSVVVVSGTQITAVTPAGLAGPADIRVTNTDGKSATLTNGWTYVGGTAPAPTLLLVSPATGPAAGSQLVTLTGTGFQTGATVTFGGALASSVTAWSAGTATCLTPAGTVGTVAVVWTNPDTQAATLLAGYAYGSTPTVTAVTPNTGATSGGTPVTVSGTSFLPGATVTFGTGAATNVVVVSAVSITALTPAGAAGSVTVTVTNPGALAGALANAFTYTAGGTPPTLTTLTPTSGPSAGGTIVTLTGTGFVAGAGVTVGGVAATSVTLVSATQVTAITPATAVAVGSAVPVTVSNPGGASATNTSPGFTYVPLAVESASDAAADPDVAIDGLGTRHVVWQTTNSLGATDILYVRSTDGGRTWTASPVTLSASTNPVSRPRIAARGNDVFVVWNEIISSSEHIVRAYSSNNGAAWSASGSFVNAGNIPPNPDVAMDGNGRVIVAWQHDGGAGPGGNMLIHVRAAYTATLAGSASTPVGVATGSISANPPSVAADGSGNALVAYDAMAVTGGPMAQFGSFDCACARSSDGAVTWGTPVVIANTGNDHLTTVVALRGSNAIVVNVLQGPAPQSGTNFLVQAYRSTDGGVTFGSAAAVGGGVDTGSTLPALAFDGFGTCFCVWEEGGDILESRSTDVGQTWSAPVNVSANSSASQTAQVAGTNGAGAVRVWADDSASAGTPDILSY